MSDSIVVYQLYLCDRLERNIFRPLQQALFTFVLIILAIQHERDHIEELIASKILSVDATSEEMISGGHWLSEAQYLHILQLVGSILIVAVSTEDEQGRCRLLTLLDQAYQQVLDFFSSVIKCPTSSHLTVLKHDVLKLATTLHQGIVISDWWHEMDITTDAPATWELLSFASKYCRIEHSFYTLLGHVARNGDTNKDSSVAFRKIAVFIWSKYTLLTSARAMDANSSQHEIQMIGLIDQGLLTSFLQLATRHRQMSAVSVATASDTISKELLDRFRYGKKYFRCCKTYTIHEIIEFKLSIEGIGSETVSEESRCHSLKWTTLLNIGSDWIDKGSVLVEKLIFKVINQPALADGLKASLIVQDYHSLMLDFFLLADNLNTCRLEEREILLEYVLYSCYKMIFVKYSSIIAFLHQERSKSNVGFVFNLLDHFRTIFKYYNYAIDIMAEGIVMAKSWVDIPNCTAIQK
jgi:hypothetical protein